MDSRGWLAGGALAVMLAPAALTSGARSRPAIRLRFRPGTAAFFGREAQGNATLTVVPGNALTTANEADETVSASITDLRATLGDSDDRNFAMQGSFIP